MSTAKRLHYGYAEYLASLEMSELKLEYCDGVIYAMAGGTRAHAQLSAAVIVALHQVLPKSCRASTSDMKVRIDASDLSTFPDVSVICGEPSTSSIDANLLSSHENRSVRQLSAILCTREPRRYRGISTRLASDPEAGVRRTVAEGLNEAEEVDPEYATVLRDVLGGDARHSIRSVAASGGGGGRKRGASLANG